MAEGEALEPMHKPESCSALHIDVLTLFPEMFSGVLGHSILKRAQDAGLLEVSLHNFRDHGIGRHSKVDDEPYGGGPGMVLKCEPIFEAIETLVAEKPKPTPHMLMLSPQGRQLRQIDMRELAERSRLLMLCGHYEGFDERIREGFDWDEVSIGDYVLTGGELPAMVIIDAVARLRQGVLGDDESSADESFEFENGLLEYPQYTRPQEFRGKAVPEILLSGNHGKIAEWRRAEAEKRTKVRRPDLIDDES